MFERNFSLQSWAELIRLQYFLIISGRNQLISWILCLELIIKETYLTRQSLLMKERQLKDYYLRLGRASSISYPIRLQDYLIINISEKNQPISQISCMQIIIKEMQHLKLLVLFECGQLCLLLNQIAGFFDHQYLRKESSNILIFISSQSSRYVSI